MLSFWILRAIAYNFSHQFRDFFLRNHNAFASGNFEDRAALVGLPFALPAGNRLNAAVTDISIFTFYDAVLEFSSGGTSGSISFINFGMSFSTTSQTCSGIMSKYS